MDVPATFTALPSRRYEEVEKAFNGIFERNPFAFALRHHASLYKDEEAVIWLNGEGKETERLTFNQLESEIMKRGCYLTRKLGLKKGDRVIL